MGQVGRQQCTVAAGASYVARPAPAPRLYKADRLCVLTDRVIAW
jgi:hypothetical protein